VIIGAYTGTIKVYDYKEVSGNPLTEVKSFLAHTSAINRIRQSPFVQSKHLVATCSIEGKVKVWDSSTWTQVQQFTHTSTVYDFEWIDSESIASCGFTETQIKIWSIRTGLVINDYINVPTSSLVYSLKMLSNKKQLAVGLGKGTINIFNINDGSYVSSLLGHTQNVKTIIQLDEHTLASGSQDLKVRIWDLKTYTSKFAALSGHANSIRGLKQISFDILASGSQDNSIKLWNTTSGEFIRNLRNHTGAVFWSVDLINSKTLISGSRDTSVKLWSWSTGECLQTILTGGLDVSSLALLQSP
jgi:WD40 repeat protein